jgi:hypothetical protein
MSHWFKLILNHALSKYILLDERHTSMPSSKRRLLILLLISGCIMILFLCTWASAPKLSNQFGWGWKNTFPDHLHYHGRDYSVGFSGCRKSTDVGQVEQIGTMPMLFGSSYPMFAGQNEVKSHGTVIIIYVEKNTGCYISYALEGSP